MGNLIKKPSELEAKQTISALIYGQAGVGKTTIGCSAPNPVLFDYDGGVTRINGAHQVPTVQIHSWEDTQQALDEIREELPETRSIVIDTAGKMLDYMSDYIIRDDSRMGNRDGSLTLKGYGRRKQMFIDFLRQMAVSGLNVIFIAHEREEKQGDLTMKRPEVGSAGNFSDLIKEMDLVGYMQMVGKNRTLCWTPTETYYAKNTCALPAEDKIPVVVNAEGLAEGNNDYFTKVLARYAERQAAARKTTNEYEQLLDAVDDALLGVKTPEELNKVVEAIKSRQPIYNSRLVTAQKVADKAKELGFKLDKVAGCYVAA